MAKKIKLPLIMENDIPVNSLEELRNNFSIPKILDYLIEEKTKLLNFLNDRYETELAVKLDNLDESSSEFVKQICEIFDVEYKESDFTTLEDFKRQKTKKEKLLSYTHDEEIISHISECAFVQDDIYDIFNRGQTSVYLCGDRFTIPLDKNGIRYIGVNKPTVIIDSNEAVDFNKKNIFFENVIFNDEYLSALKEKETSSDTGKKTIDKLNNYIILDKCYEEKEFENFYCVTTPISNSSFGRIKEYLQEKYATKDKDIYSPGICNFLTEIFFDGIHNVYCMDGIHFEKKGFRLPTEDEWMIIVDWLSAKHISTEVEWKWRREVQTIPEMPRFVPYHKDIHTSTLSQKNAIVYFRKGYGSDTRTVPNECSFFLCRTK